MDFFDNLDPLLRTFWYLAIPSSLIFLIQSIMTFVGMDATEGLEADFDGNLDSGDDVFQLFSFRNLINFLLGFSWAGISFFEVISNKFLLILVALSIGIGFVALFFVIIKQIMKFSEDNSFNILNSLNKTAEVYLTIPANRSGHGKVLVSVNGSVHELVAITDDTTSIPSGSLVMITQIENENILVVKRI